VAFYLSTAFCYFVAGAIIGYALEKHTFIWVFLLCFLTVHAVFGWNFNTAGYGLIAAWVGHFTAQLKQKRRIFLLPQAAR
jgi:hypothetical protein